MCSSVRILPQIARKPANSKLGQVRQGIGAFGEFPQPRLYSGLLEQLAKNVDFASQFVKRNRLDKFLRRCRGVPVKFLQLFGRGTRDAQCIAFRNNLTDQADGLRLGGVDAAASKQQIADDRISEISFQPRDTAETGNQPKSKFRKAKSGRLIGDDQIANQRQLKSTAKSNSLNRRDGGQWRRINCVHHPVNAFQEIPQPGCTFRRGEWPRFAVQLAEISPGAESFLSGAGNNQRMRVALQLGKRRYKSLQFRKRGGTDLIAGSAVEDQLDHAVRRIPRKCFALESLHSIFLVYIASISAA